MANKSLLLLIFAVILMLAWDSKARSNNGAEASEVEVDHDLISSLKAIFAGRISKDNLGAPQSDEPLEAERRTSEFYPKPKNDLPSIKSPPRWPELIACPCTCEWDCHRPVCCQARALLIDIKQELKEIEQTLDVKPNTTSISVIVETDDCVPVTIYGSASLDIGNNTIARELLEEIGRESEIKYQESEEPTRRKFVVMDVLLGPDHQPFRNQTFFVIESKYNYADEGMVIGRNLLEKAGAGKLEPDFTSHVVEGLKILVARPRHQEL